MMRGVAFVSWSVSAWQSEGQGSAFVSWCGSAFERTSRLFGVGVG